MVVAKRRPPVEAGRNDRTPTGCQMRSACKRFSLRFSHPFGVCRENQKSGKTGIQKPFDAIEKLVRWQMWAKSFLQKSSNAFFRQTPTGCQIRRVCKGFSLRIWHYFVVQLSSDLFRWFFASLQPPATICQPSGLMSTPAKRKGHASVDAWPSY